MQNLTRLTENYFLLGYNDKDKPENLRQSTKKIYMADIKNGFIEENKLVKRKGYVTIGNAPVEKAVLGQQRHEPSAGTKYILRARNDADGDYAVVESWSGSGNWAALTGASAQTASAEHEFVMAENATYIFNGTDTVLKTTNGTTTSEVSTIPKGIDARWWHNFLFVFGVSGLKSRLYFSDVNEPETFDAVNGYIDINTDDNEEIIGLGVLKDNLLIFKPSAIFLLTGYGTTDFALTDLKDFGAGIGTLARRSIVETGNDVYFITFYGSTPHFKSITRTVNDAFIDSGILSDAITGTMDRLVKGRIKQTAGRFDGRRVWYSVCTSGTTNNEVLVLDTETGGWTRHTGINASVFNVSTISGVPNMYFGSSTANGLSYHLNNSATSDNTAAIDFDIKTPMYAPQLGHKSRFKYLYLTADVESEVDIDVDYSIDGFTFDNLKTFSLENTGATFGTAIFGTSKFGSTTIARDRIFGGGSAYYMQYRFRNNAADEDIAIREWEVFFSPRSLRSA